MMVNRDLMAAARYTERHCIATAATVHLLDAASMSLGLPKKRKNLRRYRACAKRLFNAVGTDLADFDKDEAIDLLVAASYWRGRP